MKKNTKPDFKLYNVAPGTGIREGIEQAILMARAENSDIIVQMNGARFVVNSNTRLQKAIDAYLEVKKKMFETEQQLKQKTR